jgi:ribosomal protein S18 acetylase RimI-like enzyme
MEITSLFKIRKAVIDDAAAIASVHIKSWQTIYKNIIPQPYLDSLSSSDNFLARVNKRKELLSGNNSETLVVTFKDSIVGFCDYGKERSKIDSTIGEIYAIYLLEEYRNQRIGRRLILNAVNCLKEKGYKSLFLWVLEENLPAKKFYESLGGTVKESKVIEIAGNQYNEISYLWPSLESITKLN